MPELVHGNGAVGTLRLYSPRSSGVGARRHADPYRLNEVWQRRLARARPEKRVSLKAGNEAVRTGARHYSRDSRVGMGGGKALLF
jgi:hypothetical protein